MAFKYSCICHSNDLFESLQFSLTILFKSFTEGDYSSAKTLCCIPEWALFLVVGNLNLLWNFLIGVLSPSCHGEDFIFIVGYLSTLLHRPGSRDNLFSKTPLQELQPIFMFNVNFKKKWKFLALNSRDWGKIHVIFTSAAALSHRDGRSKLTTEEIKE